MQYLKLLEQCRRRLKIPRRDAVTIDAAQQLPPTIIVIIGSVISEDRKRKSASVLKVKKKKCNVQFIQR
jgi:hypothetical protein